MKYGQELIAELQKEIDLLTESQRRRAERINNWETDEEDCFMSMRCEERGVRNAQDKIDLIKRGGCAWFTEYATLDGKLVNAKWCNTRFGSSLRAQMPDGSVVWTTADTPRGLAKHNLRKVSCLRPAWYCFRSSASGMLGVFSGSYVLFPSDVNYATGEPASDEPLEIRPL